MRCIVGYGTKQWETSFKQMGSLALQPMSPGLYPLRFCQALVDNDRPAQAHAVAPMEFRLDDVPLDANRWIKRWRCSDINAHARDQLFLLDLLPFDYTRRYLSNVFFVKQLPDAERLALIAKFNRHVPWIVQRCGSFPASRYVRMLPKEVRELL